MMRQTRRRLTVTPDPPGDALILRDPFRPLLAACAAAAAVAPDIKVLDGRVVSGERAVERLLDNILTVVVIDLHIVEGLKEAQVFNHGRGDIAPHALH